MARTRVDLDNVMDDARGVPLVGDVEITVDEREDVGAVDVASRCQQTLVTGIRIDLDNSAGLFSGSRVNGRQIRDIQLTVGGFTDVRGHTEEPTCGDWKLRPCAGVQTNDANRKGRLVLAGKG